MQTLKIEANYRSDMSKSRVKQLRRTGYVTASVSGRNTSSIPVEVNLKDLVDQIKHSEGGTTSLIDMKVVGGPADSSGTVILKSFYKDPISRRVIDVVFQRVIMTEVIQVALPLELEGEAQGVKSGGHMDQMIYELSVSCMPGNIPPKVTVDVSNMEVGDVVRVQDLSLGEGIEVLADPDTVICICRAATVAGVEETTVYEEAAEAAVEAAEQTEESE